MHYEVLLNNNKKMKKSKLLFALIALTFVSCSNDSEFDVPVNNSIVKTEETKIDTVALKNILLEKYGEGVSIENISFDKTTRALDGSALVFDMTIDKYKTRELGRSSDWLIDSQEAQALNIPQGRYSVRWVSPEWTVDMGNTPYEIHSNPDITPKCGLAPRGEVWPQPLTTTPGHLRKRGFGLYRNGSSFTVFSDVMYISGYVNGQYIDIVYPSTALKQSIPLLVKLDVHLRWIEIAPGIYIPEIY